MIAFHNSLVGNNEGRYEMTKAIVEIEHLMAPILDGMDSKLRPRPCFVGRGRGVLSIRPSRCLWWSRVRRNEAATPNQGG